MLWSDLSRLVLDKLPGNLALADQRPIIFIDARNQQLHRIDIDEAESKTYAISTAAKGLGNRIESLQTPIGVHRVKQKIGGGEPVGMVFSARQPLEQ